MKNYCPSIPTEITNYADRDQQINTIACYKESSNPKNMWKLKMMNIRSRSNSPFEPSGNVLFGPNSHYWTDTNGLNIHIGSCDTNVIGYSREVVSKFISNIFIQEFPEMESANARTFGYDLADEISILDHMAPGKDSFRKIRIEWSSMALVFFYNEIQPNETIPLLIDDRCHNIRKKR